MSAQKASRRDFLKLTGAGVAGVALSSTASSYARIVGANDRIGVAWSVSLTAPAGPSFHPS